MILIFPLTVHFDRQFLTADNGYLIVAIYVSQLTACISFMSNGFWFLSIFSASVANTIQVLQNVFLTITGTNSLVLDGYHKSSSLWKEFARFQPCVRCCLSATVFSRSQMCLPTQSSALPRCYLFLYHSHVLIVIFVIIIMLLSRQRRRRLIHCNIGILVTLNLHAPSLHMNFKAVSKH